MRSKIISGATGDILKDKGFGVIELVIAIAIISIAVFAFMTTTRDLLALSRRNAETVQAIHLMEEGSELIRTLRDDGWEDNISTLVTGTSYGLTYGEHFVPEVTTEPEVIGQFTRTFTVSDVMRDMNDDINETGILDPGTRRFAVKVKWLSNGSEAKEVVELFYLTNLFLE